MAKQQWKFMAFSNHIDPEKEEQLKRVKLAVDDQVDKILKITSEINHGNKERNLRKKSEAIELIQDFHRQYEKLYILYENLREKVKKIVDGGGEDNSYSAPDWDAESNYFAEEFESSDVEDTLTCSSEVTKIMNSDPGSPLGRSPFGRSSGLGDILRDLEIHREKSGKTSYMLAEVSTLCMDKRRLEEEVEWKSREAVEKQDNISRLEARIMEMESASNQQERMFSSRISDFEAQAQGMQLRMDSLKHEKDELEGRVEGLMQRVSSLQGQKVEYLLQIEALRNELSLSEQQAAEQKKSLQVKVHELESSLGTTKRELEGEVYKMNREASESSAEKEKLQEKVTELLAEQNKFKDCQTMMSVKKSLEEAVESLKNELETLETERNNLQNDKQLLQVELEKEKEKSSLSKSQFEKVTKTNIVNAERKIEELAAEFRKKFEDQYRLLSRRIRVAEQLQAENKEWYRKTKDSYEKGNKDLKEITARTATELKNVKDLSLAANVLLTSIDSNAFKLEECTGKLNSRISKASCQINYTKHWAMAKNKAISNMKDDLACLVAQLDDKDAEILASRQKVWKLEDKVRELDKTIEDKDDEMLLLTEEKKEAIRQLCVWIDYHRGRSDFYKNLLSDKSTARRRAS